MSLSELTNTPKHLACTEVELDPKQDRDWMQTRAKFMYTCPGFTHLLYRMMNPRRQGQKAVFTKEVPVAATDGLYLFLNPDDFLKRPIGERVFIVGHEVVHAVLNHANVFHMYRTRGKVTFSDGTDLPYVENVMQHAADHIINDMLVESSIGTLPKDALHDKALVTAKDSLVEAYRKLYKKDPNPQAPKTGLVLRPGTGEGKGSAQAALERNDGAWKTATSAAMQAEKAQGRKSGAMTEMFDEVLEPQVSWDQKIQGFFRSKMGSGSYDWRRPDRRLITRNIFTPARSGFGCNEVAVAVDTSGSIDAVTVAMFLAEVGGILQDVKPRKVHLIWCDAKVHRVDEIEDMGDIAAARAKGAPGRGGTRFEPVFDWLAEEGVKPDALVYLTDGLGSFPTVQPDYPVLWGSIHCQPEHYPWGEVVMVPKQLQKAAA